MPAICCFFGKIRILKTGRKHYERKRASTPTSSALATPRLRPRRDRRRASAATCWGRWRGEGGQGGRPKPRNRDPTPGGRTTLSIYGPIALAGRHVKSRPSRGPAPLHSPPTPRHALALWPCAGVPTPATPWHCLAHRSCAGVPTPATAWHCRAHLPCPGVAPPERPTQRSVATQWGFFLFFPRTTGDFFRVLICKTIFHLYININRNFTQALYFTSALRCLR